jgi:hypothetical protein
MASCFCECHIYPGTYPPPCGVCGHDTRTGRMVGTLRDGWEPYPLRDAEDYIELQRHALAVTRLWDALSRCTDEFPDDLPVCGEYQERLDMAIDGLMKLVDREMWDRRQAWMREATANGSA